MEEINSSVSNASKNPVVLFIEPFYGGSHKQLVDTLRKYVPSSTLVTMTPKKWHWRARCSALNMYTLIPCITTEKVLFCSSVLNLAELLGVRQDLCSLKKIIYFHENQFIYPIRDIKNRDIQYPYNEIMSCLAADVILFNSNFNRTSMLDGLNKVLKLLPDNRPKNIKEIIKSKSKVLYFPIEFSEIQHNPKSTSTLHILWSHRWEFDKGPEDFFDVLRRLKNNNFVFNVSILGESFTDNPDVFEKAKEELKHEIKHFGYVEDKEDYFSVLESCHVIVSTAKHEFFGVSVLEAAYYGCFVLAPNNLVYPELYPLICLYNTQEQLFEKLKEFCLNPSLAVERRKQMNIDFSKFSINTLSNEYITLFQ